MNLTNIMTTTFSIIYDIFINFIQQIGYTLLSILFLLFIKRLYFRYFEFCKERYKIILIDREIKEYKSTDGYQLQIEEFNENGIKISIMLPVIDIVDDKKMPINNNTTYYANISVIYRVNIIEHFRIIWQLLMKQLGEKIYKPYSLSNKIRISDTLFSIINERFNVKIQEIYRNAEYLKKT